MEKGETRKEHYENCLALKKQELSAVFAQIGSTINNVDAVKLNRKAEEILLEIDDLEGKISQLKASKSNLNIIERKLEKSFQKIDYSETKRFAGLIKKQFDCDGGAILLFLQRNKKQLGKYCVEELIYVLMNNQIIDGKIEGDYKRYPIDIGNVNYLPSKAGFIQGISEHLGIDSSSDLEEALTQIRRCIYSSLSIGSTIFFEIKGINKLTDKEEFLNWFLGNFWQPLIDEINILLKQNKNKVIAALIADSQFPINCSSSIEFCHESILTPDKIIEISLSDWTFYDIYNWLIWFKNLSDQSAQMTLKEIEKMAQEIHDESEGTPESVCLRLRERFL